MAVRLIGGHDADAVLESAELDGLEDQALPVIGLQLG